MLKLKSIIYVLSVLTILICLHPINSSISGDCDSKVGGAGTSTVTGNYIYSPGHMCTEDPFIEYDTANSDETIDRNGSAALFVIGNNGPFIWSISGTGFTLENEGQPTGPTNTLYADGTACGAATITVTGCDGIVVTGYVRCASGTWVQTDYCQVVSKCMGFYNCGTGGCEEIIGKYKYHDQYCVQFYSYQCGSCYGFGDDEGCPPQIECNLGFYNCNIRYTIKWEWVCP